MATYRSLIGGAFSATPTDKRSGPVSIRMNNPGAVNGAAWERSYPGYVTEIETTPGNRSTVFESPEHGIAVWWDLLRRYRKSNATTVADIVTRYGGGQDYSAYLRFVLKRTGLAADTPIDLDDDRQLLLFGRAMFRYEAGCEIPWTDAQILYGFKCGREIAQTGRLADHAPPVVSGPVVAAPGLAGPQQPAPSGLPDLLKHLVTVLAASPVVSAAPTTPTPAPAGPAPAKPILSFIDQLIGGEGLAGKKTVIAVLAYVVVAILQAVGVIGAATPAGQILTIVTAAFSALGGLSKVDRIIQALGTIAVKTAAKP